jgi:Ethanolamine utilization protein EutJ (predicted chaperonin)
MRVLEEPTAAAIAYGLHQKPDVHHILVYDFGGGTLDVSLLYVHNGFVTVTGVDGDEHLGGACCSLACLPWIEGAGVLMSTRLGGAVPRPLVCGGVVCVVC